MSKRYQMNMDKLRKLADKYGIPMDKVSCKEKYGRFDITTYAGQPFLGETMRLENESYNMCQTCGRTSYQIRHDRGRVTHHCIYHTFTRFLTRQLFKARKILKRIWVHE